MSCRASSFANSRRLLLFFLSHQTRTPTTESKLLHQSTLATTTLLLRSFSLALSPLLPSPVFPCSSPPPASLSSQTHSGHFCILSQSRWSSSKLHNDNTRFNPNCRRTRAPAARGQPPSRERSGACLLRSSAWRTSCSWCWEVGTGSAGQVCDSRPDRREIWRRRRRGYDSRPGATFALATTHFLHTLYWINALSSWTTFPRLEPLSSWKLSRGRGRDASFVQLSLFGPVSLARVQADETGLLLCQSGALFLFPGPV